MPEEPDFMSSLRPGRAASIRAKLVRLSTSARLPLSDAAVPRLNLYQNVTFPL